MSTRNSKIPLISRA